MKKGIAVLGISLALVLGGYSSFWYYQAHEMQKSLSAALEPLTKGSVEGMLLHYDDVKVGGFPFQIKISLVNPEISYVNDDEESYKVSLQGAITDVCSLMGGLESIQLTGRTTLQTPDGPDKLLDGKIAIEFGSAGNFKALLTEPHFLQNLGAYLLRYESKIVLSDFRLRENTPQGEKEMVTIDFASLEYKAVVSQADERNFAFTALLQGLKILEQPKEEAHDLISAFSNALSDELLKRQSKINAECKFRIELPDEKTLSQLVNSPILFLAQPLPHFAFHLDSFNWSSNFSTITHTVLFVLGEKTANQVELDIKSDSTVTCHKAYCEAIVSALHAIEEGKTPLLASSEYATATRTFLSKHLKEIEPVILESERFAEVQCNYDLSVSCNKRNFDTQILLSKFQLLFKQFGIQLQGKASRLQGENTGEITLTLVNYKTIINEAITGYNMVASFLSSIEPERLPIITEELKSAILSYLQELSNENDPAQPNLSITCTYDDSTGILISGLTPEEFTLLTNQLFEEFTPQA